MQPGLSIKGPFVWFVVPILPATPPQRPMRLSTNHTNLTNGQANGRPGLRRD